MKSFFKKYIYWIGVFLGATIPRIILILFAYPVRTISDEISTISNGALWAGFDWSDVLSNAGYYGSGMIVLFTPIIRFVDNPILMYRLILLCESLLYGMGAIICFYILRKLFNINNEKYCCLVSIACSYVVAVRTMIVYNEHMLTFLSWVFILIILLACKNEYNKRLKCKLSIICVIFLSYSLTVHTRAIIFWGAVAIAIIIGYFLYRRWILSVPILICIGGPLYFLVQRYNDFMKENLWLKNGDHQLRNEAVTSSPLIELFRPRTWHAWGNIFFGQIQTINVLVGGIFLATLVLIVTLSVRYIRLRQVKHQNEITIGFTIIVGWFCLSAIIVTILGQVASWGIWATDGMSLGIPSSSYGIKAFTYIRYFAIYCGPLVMIFFAWCYYHKKWFQQSFKTILLIFIELQIYWFCAIIPYIYQNNTLTEVYIPFALWNENREIDIRLFLPASIVCIIIMFAFYVCSKKEKIFVPVILTIGILLFQYYYNGIIYDYNNSIRSYNIANAGYELINDLTDYQDVPNDIYVYDATEKEDHQNYMMYQILLKKYHIVPGLPSMEENEAIIFSNGLLVNEEELTQCGYSRTQLDENEFVYVKGDKLQETMSLMGFTMEN